MRLRLSFLLSNKGQQVVKKSIAMNGQIATAAQEQSSITEEINRNISSISDISNQTASGAEQSSAASHK
ncbi:MAG: methyl-accepting chemotaxis protein [Shewanella psychromarinicola]|jgi:methyl-accepting chemotaxis protein